MACAIRLSSPSTVVSWASSVLSASAAILEGLSAISTEGAQVQVSRRRSVSSANGDSVATLPSAAFGLAAASAMLASDIRALLLATLVAPGTSSVDFGLRASMSAIVTNDCAG